MLCSLLSKDKVSNAFRVYHWNFCIVSARSNALWIARSNQVHHGNRRQDFHSILCRKNSHSSAPAPNPNERYHFKLRTNSKLLKLFSVHWSTTVQLSALSINRIKFQLYKMPRWLSSVSSYQQYIWQTSSTYDEWCIWTNDNTSESTFAIWESHLVEGTSVVWTARLARPDDGLIGDHFETDCRATGTVKLSPPDPAY